LYILKEKALQMQRYCLQLSKHSFSLLERFDNEVLVKMQKMDASFATGSATKFLTKGD